VIAADIDRQCRGIGAAGRCAADQARAVACNVADPAQVDAVVQAAVDAFRAARHHLQQCRDHRLLAPRRGWPAPRWSNAARGAMTGCEDVNVNGVIYGCQAAIRQFQKQEAEGKGRGGAIVNTASVSGLMGYGGVLYGMTKGAVVRSPARWPSKWPTRASGSIRSVRRACSPITRAWTPTTDEGSHP
jgi:NAD(P)-dependent dehydrogenase (short-subunit alcohol dehydrogenase family)